MKRFLFIIFCAALRLVASPVGNTAAPAMIQNGLFVPTDSWVDFRIGYEGDFVSDARMNYHGSGRVDSFGQSTNSGTFTLNFVNRMDLYAVFGGSSVETDWRTTNSVAETVTRIEIETKNSFLWAVGARAILIEWGNASFGTGGRYSACQYHPNWVSSDGHRVGAEGAHFDWNEWQINCDFSYKIDLFIPYIGVKYCRALAKLSDFPVPIAPDLSESNTLQTRGPVGVYVGCALTSGDYFSLNCEGRLIDEEAVSVMADFRF